MKSLKSFEKLGWIGTFFSTIPKYKNVLEKLSLLRIVLEISLFTSYLLFGTPQKVPEGSPNYNYVTKTKPRLHVNIRPK